MSVNVKIVVVAIARLRDRQEYCPLLDIVGWKRRLERNTRRKKLLFTNFHEPVNLGNPDEVTILEFAKETLALSGSKSKIEYRPLPQDDPKVRKPDISRARKLLNWEPKMNRLDGMKRTLEFFKGKLQTKKPGNGT